MFHAQCITSPNFSQMRSHVRGWTEKANIQQVDILDLSQQKIGIGEIRTIITFLSRAPYASSQKVVIVNGEAMTPESQHAFLKTLEEPPQKSILFILTSSTDFLLPTILSRISITTLSDEKVQNTTQYETDIQFWKTMTSKSIAEKLKVTSEIAKDRDQVKTWLESQINCLRTLLLSSDAKSDWITKKQCAGILKNLQATHTLIDQNIHLKLALDHLFLQIPQIPKNA